MKRNFFMFLAKDAVDSTTQIFICNELRECRYSTQFRLTLMSTLSLREFEYEVIVMSYIIWKII